MSRVAVLSHVLFISLACYCVESCVQKHIQAQVPGMLEPGYVVSQVNLDGCGIGPLGLTSSDPAFTVEMDGTIQAVLVTIVPEDGRSFWITVQDRTGHRWLVDVHLSLTGQVSNNVVLKRSKRRWSPIPLSVHENDIEQVGPGQVSNDAVLKRSKRRWSPPPFSVRENDRGPFPKDIDMIASDTSVNFSLYYEITGPGVTLKPMGLFSVIPNTGMLRVHDCIDREQYPKFVFTAHAYNKYTRAETDAPLPITVNIEDENDNAPQFSGPMNYAVAEQCPMGTSVGKVLATDKDQEGTAHTKIMFALKNGANLFRIDPYSGVIYATTNSLDREATEKHILDVEARDMDGASNGLFTLGKAVVSLNDINDNPPTFRQSLYKGQVNENKADVMVLRISVDDKDLKDTPNWRAVYDITKGNESGNFLIKTDPQTNDGLLYVTKPLDYEKQPKVNLDIMARNEAPLEGSSSTWQKVPAEITVDNVDEGPEFFAPIYTIRVKENLPNGTLIGTYTATDPETNSTKDIKYYKLTDRGSWINVMDSTGELKTAMTIDRESPLVSNNTYNITVKAVDKSQKSSTGTVMLLIEDVNDNAPMITKPDQVLCSKDGTQGSVLIEAKDLDQKLYSDPFSFDLGKPDSLQWKLTSVTGTSAKLQPTVDLPNDVYKVPVSVKDQQGFGVDQSVTVRVCDCSNIGECAPQRFSTKLGVWGILAMLLGLLLLLLLCLLCICACSTKGEKLAMADDGANGGMLLRSNYEAPGEEVKDALILNTSGVDVLDSSKGGGVVQEHQTMLSSYGTSYGQKQNFGASMHQNNMQGFMNTNTLSSGQYSTGMYGTSFRKYPTMSAMEGFKENMMEKKLSYFREEDARFAEDILRPYGYEGVGSPAGSVGCCSILNEQDSLDFLDSLGPKFKTLADVCTSKSKRGGQ